MSRRLKYVLGCVFALVFCSAVAILCSCSRERRREVTCERLDVRFRDSLKFVCEQDVRGYLSKEYGAVIGERIDSVKLWKIEEIINGKSAVDKCEAWVSDSCGNGILHIAISQREPAVRFQKGDVGFYVDDRGYIFPLHSSYTADVPVVSGNIPIKGGPAYRGEAGSEQEREWIAGILQMTKRVEKLKSGALKVERMSVNGDGDIVLSIAGGKEQYIFGKPDMLDDKFARMEKYRNQILPAKGAGYYKTVNLKYNNQIICRKDI